MKLSTTLGIWRFFLFLAVYCIIFPPYYLASKLHTKTTYRIGSFFLNAWRYVLGLRVIIKGQPNVKSQTLFCINHISYMDITLVGPYIPGRFIAKSEVKKWPIFGQLTTLYGSVYVDRSRTGTQKGLTELKEKIDKKQHLILFPEGTTSDGCRVLPFTSSYFDIAIKNNLTVQPVTLAYAGWDGMPMPRYIRKLVGWFSLEQEMLPHLWQMARLGKVEAILTFHPPLEAKDFASRKELAHATWEIVNDGLFKSFSPSIRTEVA